MVEEIPGPMEDLLIKLADNPVGAFELFRATAEDRAQMLSTTWQISDERVLAALNKPAVWTGLFHLAVAAGVIEEDPDGHWDVPDNSRYIN